MKQKPTLALGASRPLDNRGPSTPVCMPAQHLVTHGVVVGMTGSGKTGLLTVAVEEALRNEVPVLMIDVKGDLPNLLLTFPDFDPLRVAPWVETEGEDEAAQTALAIERTRERETALRAWGITEVELADFCARTAIRVITPGSTAGESLHYRALSNAGLWIIGRLQTDADRARVVDGLATSVAGHRAEAAQLAATLKRLTPRWFVMRNAHDDRGTVFLQPRWAMSYLTGPMTRVDLQRARELRRGAPTRDADTMPSQI